MKEKRIMVIDDEEQFLRMMKLNIEELGGYKVLTMAGAKDLIAQIHSFKPHLILLDLLMPGIGGLEACEMLNNDPLGKKIPIIILSALDKDIDKLKAYKLGAVDYITKPVNIDVLIEKIEKATQKLTL